ncbi:MAG TPA: hypothetical protein VLT90_03650 [Terriglobales bacterium]|nr:hypothetical protein [Terriglobales bacterium]
MIREQKHAAPSPPPPTPPPALESSIQNLTPEGLLRLASNTALTEDLALSVLNRSDLPVAVLEAFAKNGTFLKLRKAKIALASHPHTPRHVSVPLIRQFYTFDLMKVALTPGVPADVKVVADEVLVARLKSVTLGERLALARRGSGRVAGALLLDGEAPVMRMALENGRLTEVFVIQAVLRPEANVVLVQAVSQHKKWSYRREIRIALLRTEHLSLARALEFSLGLPLPFLREVLHSSRMPSRVKEQLLREHESADKHRGMQ